MKTQLHNNILISIMNRKLFLLFAILNISIASAQTFNVNGINFNIITGTTNVEVGSNQYTTASVNIPLSVIYNAVTYSVTSIGVNAFRSNNGLTSITIPNSVTFIGEGAFLSSSLTSIFIPDSVTSMGDSAFSGCRYLTSVTIGNSLTSIGRGVFAYCNVLTAVTISNSVNSIGVSAFNGCTGLTSITIPNSVTTIGINAFFGCTALASIIIPDSVTSIGFDAFYRCTGLTSVTIPNSVTNIGGEAFSGCSSLTTVNCAIDVPLAISADIFGYVNQAACALNVPVGSVNAYKAAAVWKNFNPINGSLSTDNFKTKNNSKLYPNPVKNELFLELDNTSKTKIKVIDTNGKVLITKTVNNTINSIDTSSLANGLYFVKLSSDEGTFTKKVIKN